MNINSNPIVNRLAGFTFAATLTFCILTGCSSTQSSSFTKVEMPVRHSKAFVGNLVALIHDGKTIFVNEPGVEAQLSRGDTLAFIGDDKPLSSFKAQVPQDLQPL